MSSKDLISDCLRIIKQRLLGFREWRNREYAPPSPGFIKERVLLRNGFPNGTWVESGTYLGQTTLFLSKHSTFVYSIEPDRKLFSRAKIRFSNNKKVEILNGLSEELFPALLPKLTGNINFWLDGHYSGGITHKGPVETPIVEELNAIQANLGSYRKISILIDDVRCFNPEVPEYSSYPSLDVLVEWARRNRFGWHIEHDIFIMKNWK